MTLAGAVCLGLAHGPAELLPISSSGHTILIGWFMGSSFSEPDPELRKDLEVALHAGTAAALLIGLRGELARASWLHDRRAGLVLALALVPPAVVGLAFEERIERLGTPPQVAGGLVAGAVVLALADRGGRSDRRAGDARALDGLLLGLAQAVALAPGISRNGATLALCRARGFGRAAADELSGECGLPVLVGAAVLRGAKRAWGARAAGARDARFGDRSGGRRTPGEPAVGGPILAGAVAAFVSTLAAQRVLGRRERAVSLVACAAYRVGLAGVVAARLRRLGRG